MAARRIFILWRHPLFYDSLRLLLEDPQLDLVGSGPADRTPKEEISSANPDVVIVEKPEGDDLDPSEEPPSVGINTKVVYLSLADNVLNVVHRRRLMLTRVEELRALLLEGPNSGDVGARPR